MTTQTIHAAKHALLKVKRIYRLRRLSRLLKEDFKSRQTLNVSALFTVFIIEAYVNVSDDFKFGNFHYKC